MNKISKEKWIEAFAYAVDIAIEEDYFSDILRFELYPNYLNVKSEEDEEEIDARWEKAWEEVDKAFKEVFGFERGSII